MLLYMAKRICRCDEVNDFEIIPDYLDVCNVITRVLVSMRPDGWKGCRGWSDVAMNQAGKSKEANSSLELQ